MFCPVCGSLLKETEVASVDGARLLVHHCTHCSGTWFDKEEIVRIAREGVVRLSYLHEYPQKNYLTPSHMDCPKDRSRLNPYKKSLDSGETGLYSCKSCYGIWAPQRSLASFVADRDKQEKSKQTIGLHVPQQALPAVAALFILLMASVWTLGYIEYQKNPEVYVQEEATQIHDLNIEQTGVGTVIISFQTATPVETTLEYGMVGGSMEQVVVSEVPSTSHRATLQLPFNTSFTYRVKIKDEGTSLETVEDSFMTGGMGEGKILKMKSGP